jgi:hypothetical protein
VHNVIREIGIEWIVFVVVIDRIIRDNSKFYLTAGDSIYETSVKGVFLF